MNEIERLIDLFTDIEAVSAFVPNRADSTLATSCHPAPGTLWIKMGTDPVAGLEKGAKTSYVMEHYLTEPPNYGTPFDNKYDTGKINLVCCYSGVGIEHCK